MWTGLCNLMMKAALAGLAGTFMMATGTVTAADAGSPCLAGSDARLADSSEGLSDPFLVAVADESRVIRLLECDTGSLQRAVVRAEPGQRAEIGILLANPGDRAAFVVEDADTSRSWMSDWAYLQVRQVIVAAGESVPITLHIRVPADFSVGERHEHRFYLGGEDGHQLSLTVRLEVIEEQPMFRDGFEIDPVLGQFSQSTRSANPSRNSTAAVSAGAVVGPQ